MPVGMYLRTCGSREVLESAFDDSEIVTCSVCLGAPGHHQSL